MIIQRLNNEILGFDAESGESFLLTKEQADAIVACQGTDDFDAIAPALFPTGTRQECYKKLRAVREALKEACPDLFVQRMTRRSFSRLVAAGIPAVLVVGMPSPASAQSCDSCGGYPMSQTVLAANQAGASGTATAFLSSPLTVCIDNTAVSVELVALDPKNLYFDNDMVLTVTQPGGAMTTGGVVSAGVSNCTGVTRTVPTTTVGDATTTGTGSATTVDFSPLFQSGGTFVCGEHSVSFQHFNCVAHYGVNAFAIRVS